jgi:glutathione S-transferase
MKAKLYGSRLSPFVEKTVRALAIKNVEFELVEPQSIADLKKWNPATGKMPVVEIDGARTHDSSRIVRRLEELVPDPALFSKDPATANRQRFVEDWSDESLYWYQMAFRWAPENEKDTARQVSSFLPSLVRPLAGVILPRVIGGAARSQGLAREPLSFLMEELGRRFDELLTFLGDKPFMFSDEVNVADISILGQALTMKSGPTPQCVELIQERPALVAYLDRVDGATRPKNERAGAELRAA